MNIKFSNQGSLRNIKNFFESSDLSDTKDLHISLHEKWVNVHPAHLVFAAALALQAGRENSTIDKNPPRSALYLDRMGLYDFLNTPSPFEAYRKKDPSGRFVPLSIIRNEEDQTNFITEMIPLLHLSEKNSRIITYIIGELVRNVLEHSYSKDGAIVAAQYYKKDHRIGIAICDTGIGLWKSLQLWHPRTDREALELALTPGISGTTLREGGTEQNAGAGLFFTKSIAKISRGYFSIYSGDSIYTLLKTRSDQKTPKLVANPFSEHHAFSDQPPRFSGTLVAIDIPLDNTKKFQTLLEEIGNIYESAIRERKNARIRKPNFI